MEITTNLYLLRVRHKLTQKQMAEIAGCSISAYKNYEYGRRKKIPVQVIVRIAEYFNVTTDKILIEGENMAVINKDLLDEIIKSLEEIAAHDATLFDALLIQIRELRKSVRN